MDDLRELQEEMVDRFGEYPVEVDYLVKATTVKVLAMRERVVHVKQVKDQINILISEEASYNINGQKLFELSNKFGRNVGLGMDGKCLKLTLQIKKMETEKWLSIIIELLEGLAHVKKEEVSASS